jgi:hypothetical protein
MHEPGWLPFLTAALEVQQRFRLSQAEACRKLRQACGDQAITSMKAPCDGGRLPLEFWVRVSPREWREREVDYDGPDAHGCEIEVMLKEKDFQSWLDQLSAPVSKSDRTPYRQRLAKQAIDDLQLPDNLPNNEIEKRVGDWLKSRNHPPISRTTILRAAGRRNR